MKYTHTHTQFMSSDRTGWFCHTFIRFLLLDAMESATQQQKYHYHQTVNRWWWDTVENLSIDRLKEIFYLLALSVECTWHFSRNDFRLHTHWIIIVSTTLNIHSTICSNWNIFYYRCYIGTWQMNGPKNQIAMRERNKDRVRNTQAHHLLITRLKSIHILT